MLKTHAGWFLPLSSQKVGLVLYNNVNDILYNLYIYIELHKLDQVWLSVSILFPDTLKCVSTCSTIVNQARVFTFRSRSLIEKIPISCCWLFLKNGTFQNLKMYLTDYYAAWNSEKDE